MSHLHQILNFFSPILHFHLHTMSSKSLPLKTKFIQAAQRKNCFERDDIFTCFFTPPACIKGLPNMYYFLSKEVVYRSLNSGFCSTNSFPRLYYLLYQQVSYKNIFKGQRNLKGVFAKNEKGYRITAKIY